MNKEGSEKDTYGIWNLLRFSIISWPVRDSPYPICNCTTQPHSCVAPFKSLPYHLVIIVCMICFNYEPGAPATTDLAGERIHVLQVYIQIMFACLTKQMSQQQELNKSYVFRLSIFPHHQIVWWLNWPKFPGNFLPQVQEQNKAMGDYDFNQLYTN